MDRYHLHPFPATGQRNIERAVWLAPRLAEVDPAYREALQSRQQGITEISCIP